MDNRTKNMYVIGNAARQLEAVPDRKKEQPKKELSHAARRNREKASQMSMGYVIFLSIVTLAAVYVCVTYLKLHSDISATSSNVTKLKSKINALQVENDALDYSINSYTDVNNIIKVATEELGMVQASKSQVSFYKSSESEYMKQFTDIPEK